MYKYLGMLLLLYNILVRKIVLLYMDKKYIKVSEIENNIVRSFVKIFIFDFDVVILL